MVLSCFLYIMYFHNNCFCKSKKPFCPREWPSVTTRWCCVKSFSDDDDDGGSGGGLCVGVSLKPCSVHTLCPYITHFDLGISCNFMFPKTALNTITTTLPSDFSVQRKTPHGQTKIMAGPLVMHVWVCVCAISAVKWQDVFCCRALRRDGVGMRQNNAGGSETHQLE